MKILFRKSAKSKKHSTKDVIIDYLRSHGNSSLGEIVMNLSLSYTEGLNNILELKQDGVIENQSPFKYRLAGS
ncbi:MAG: hypothetical protein GXO83_00865 [Chlorobi bacterium]|nr:hypothetical protein [Chlorobiota bacterium]